MRNHIDSEVRQQQEEDDDEEEDDEDDGDDHALMTWSALGNTYVVDSRLMKQ